MFCWYILPLVLLGFLAVSLHASEVASTAEMSFPVSDKAYHEMEIAELAAQSATGNTATELPLWDVLKLRAKAEPFNVVATVLFLCAILHAFVAPKFAKLARRFEVKMKLDVRAGKIKPNAEGKVSSIRATVFHFLGEVEAVFGIWAVILFGIMCAWPDVGWDSACNYMNTRNYTEPVFVVIIMAIASTRPVVVFASKMLGKLAGLGGGSPGAWWISILTLAPIFGSFITEPAAMTIAAMLLARQIYSLKPSKHLCYATLGLLFVNISVGGTLTNFAAPPVLMVASKWEWSLWAMLSQFGWKAFLGILSSNLLFWFLFKAEFARLAEKKQRLAEVSEAIDDDDRIPVWVTFVHFGFMVWTVVMLLQHHMAMFVAGFLFFLAFTMATARYQSLVRLRGPLLVGFFLAGLVVHGGLQSWWIGPLLGSLTEVPLFLGSTILTSFNDNAAITFLASQVPALSLIDPETGIHLTGDAYVAVNRLHYAVLAGAVTGGGLTVIANAPNPAGQSILGKYFDGGVSPLWLLLYALIPTVIMGACFMLLPH
jgi:hypothetical protein